MNHALLERVESVGRPRILVVGDLILERDVIAKKERSVGEDTGPHYRAMHRVHRLGGAGRLAAILSELGAEVRLIAGVGDDSEANIARALCDESKIDDRLVVDLDDRPTSLRERFMIEVKGRGAPEQRFAVDHVTTDSIPAEAESFLWQHLAEAVSESDLVMISDHDCGVVSPSLLRSLITACRTLGIRVIADACHGVDLAKFEGVEALLVDRLEAQIETGMALRKLEVAPRLGRELLEELKIDCSIMSLGHDGMAVVLSGDRESLIADKGSEVFPTDETNAIVFAVLGLCLTAGADYRDAAEAAHRAGGLDFRKKGIDGLNREDLIRELSRESSKSRNKRYSLEKLLAEVEDRRSRGERIVFTNGCFDLFQPGHVRLLSEASVLGDFLIVGLNSDESVKRIKGPNRPVNSEAARVEFLEAIECVDAVTVFEADTPFDLIKAIAPDVLVKGSDHALKDVVGRGIVEAAGGRVVLVTRFDGHSTKKIVHGPSNRTLTLHSPSMTTPAPMSRRPKKTSEKKPKS